MIRYTDRVFVPPASSIEPCEALDSATCDLWASGRYLQYLANGLTVTEAINALKQEITALITQRYQ